MVSSQIEGLANGSGAGGRLGRHRRPGRASYRQHERRALMRALAPLAVGGRPRLLPMLPFWPALLLASSPHPTPRAPDTDSAHIDPGALAGVAGRAAADLARRQRQRAEGNQAAIADIGSATVQSRQRAGASVPQRAAP
ncbi:hypothetical protein ACU4GD_07115 [Cupriavidus basilensis]